jgi:hypothetical protein
MRRASAWTAVGALVVLVGRTLAYALAPQPTLLSLQLERSVGGPRLVVVSLAAVGLAGAVSAAVVGLVALAVRERLALERRRVVAPPRLRPVRLVARAVALSVTTCLAFALFESWLHWRAGLGWHGIHCLVGPVHRDAIPILLGLSLVAAALAEAVEHLIAWARRTFAHVVSVPISFPALRPRLPVDATAGRDARRPGAVSPRGPPAPAVART